MPFLQAVGPVEVSTARDEFFKLLGVAPIPDTGPYFVPMEDFIQTLPALTTAKSRSNEVARLRLPFYEAGQHPWTKDEFPDVAAWLKENDVALNLAISGLKRPSVYLPLVADASASGSSLDDAKGGVVLRAREVARAVAARATFRLRSGRTEEAWQDALACHLIARRIQGGVGLFRAILPYRIDGLACSVDWAIAEHGNLTASQAKRMQADLAQLPPLPTLDDPLREERLTLLDIVCMAHKQLVAPLVDWNEVLRDFNKGYDQVCDACDQSTYPEQKRACSALPPHTPKFEFFIAGRGFGRTNKFEGAWFGTQRTSGIIVQRLLPPAEAICAARSNALVRSDLSAVAFALAGYRADHGRYPEKLAELAPLYIDRLPLDPFTAGPLHYKSTPNGFLLYSVGENEIDDGGRNDYSDPNKGFDDIVVRVPYQPPAKMP